MSSKPQQGEAHQQAVIKSLRQRLRCPEHFASDEDLLRISEGTLARLGAELEIATKEFGRAFALERLYPEIFAMI